MKTGVWNPSDHQMRRLCNRLWPVKQLCGCCTDSSGVSAAWPPSLLIIDIFLALEETLCLELLCPIFLTLATPVQFLSVD